MLNFEHNKEYTWNLKDILNLKRPTTCHYANCQRLCPRKSRIKQSDAHSKMHTTMTFVKWYTIILLGVTDTCEHLTL